jgi:hypothetical protein
LIGEGFKCPNLDHQAFGLLTGRMIAFGSRPETRMMVTFQ